jgi:hypothetical protein
MLTQKKASVSKSSRTEAPLEIRSCITKSPNALHNIELPFIGIKHHTYHVSKLSNSGKHASNDCIVATAHRSFL